MDEQQVLAWASAHSPVPLFCFWEFSVGKGRAIGGLVLDGRDQGAKAAELVNAILAGAQPKTLAPRAALRGDASNAITAAVRRERKGNARVQRPRPAPAG